MALRNRDFQEMYGDRMARLALTLQASDLANIKVPAEANPVKGERSHISSHKGGHPPVDYTAVEMLVDLRYALYHGRFREAYRTYITLKRLTNA